MNILKKEQMKMYIIWIHVLFQQIISAIMFTVTSKVTVYFMSANLDTGCNNIIMLAEC